jgi:hypothetical protein
MDHDYEEVITIWALCQITYVFVLQQATAQEEEAYLMLVFSCCFLQ